MASAKTTNIAGRASPDATNLPGRYEGRVVDRADGVARREFLAWCAALGASGIVSRHPAEAQMATAKPHRIDVHHHHTPPPYVAAITARNVPGPVRDWTPEKSIADMDKAGVATSITSITTPALRFPGGASPRNLGRG